MVKITLEYASVDQAIVALGKLAALPVKAITPNAAGTVIVGVESAPAPAAPAIRTRRQRADKGQPRGPNAATTQAAGAGTGGTPQPAVPGAPAEGAAPAASTNAAPAAEAQGQKPQGQEQLSGAAPDVTAVQKALEAVFNKHQAPVAMALLSRFGVKRLRDLLPAQYAEFVTTAAEVEKTGVV